MFLSTKKEISEVNFWRKNTNQFKALSSGEPFFFLVKNEPGISGERAVLGKATFDRYEKLSINEAWSKYREGNGDENKESFITRMDDLYGTDTKVHGLGCIILKEFQLFDNPIYLSELGITFQNSIVSGKGITENEVNIILEHGINSIQTFQESLIGFTDDDEGFPEGKRVLKQHLKRERNPKIIEIAKERFLKRYGKLFCQVCGFDFKKTYGEIGEGYIEGHHTKPISEMDENEKTRVEDIALVCANCHRMLHRKRPWITIDNLIELL